MAKNQVISGDYINCSIGIAVGTPYIIVKMFKTLKIDKTTVSSYEVIDVEESKSIASAVGRGLLGAVFLGGVGALVGGMSAKKKQTYNIIISFKDGKRSLLEVDDKIYKSIKFVLD